MKHISYCAFFYTFRVNTRTKTFQRETHYTEAEAAYRLWGQGWDKDKINIVLQVIKKFEA